MIERLRKHIANSDYARLGLELLVVVIGILLAFQIDRWGEDRRDRILESEYLLRLQEDLQIEVGRMDDALLYARARIAAVRLLEEVSANPQVAARQPGEVAVALETAMWLSFPQVDASVYTELQSTGNLALIRSQSLRRNLANHYASLHHDSRVGLNIGIQQLFEERTAGILTTDELTIIERASWGEELTGVSEARAIEIAEALAARQDALDLLPSIAQHNVFNSKVIDQNRRRAIAIIDTIENLLAESSK
jgi:hypothetical protein